MIRLCLCQHSEHEHADESTSTRCMATSCPCRRFEPEPATIFEEKLTVEELARRLVEASVRVDETLEGLKVSREVHKTTTSVYEDLYERFLLMDGAVDKVFLVKTDDGEFAVTTATDDGSLIAHINPVERA